MNTNRNCFKFLFFIVSFLCSAESLADGFLAVSRTNPRYYGFGYSDFSALTQCGLNANCRVVMQLPRGNCAAFAVESTGSAAGWYMALDIDQAILYATDKCVEAGAVSVCNVLFSQCI